VFGIEWLDVFTRNDYKTILIESLCFCQQNKGMEIFAWCIMTNHVHLVFRSSGEEASIQYNMCEFKRGNEKNYFTEFSFAKQKGT
jgi:REP element-mobilizing transposase RayT